MFLALDHDAAFISASAIASLALNAATAIYITVYVLLAQRRSIWISSSLAFAAWLAAALTLGPVHWTACSAFALNVLVFGICFFIVEPFRLVSMPSTTRPWYDFIARSAMVALLVGVVVTLSSRIGPAGSGVLAVFPVIYTSIMFILHRRVGGFATAAVLANAIPRSCRLWHSVVDFASRQLFRSDLQQPSSLRSESRLFGTLLFMPRGTAKSPTKQANDFSHACLWYKADNRGTATICLLF